MPLVSAKAIDVNAQEEGVVLRAYRDAVGVWTLGAGSTNADKYAVSVFGPIKAGVTCTREQALQVMDHSMQTNYGVRAAKALGPGAKPQHIDGAAIFDYNTGAVHRASWVKYYKAGPDWAAVHDALVLWNKGRGRGVLAGLTRRREREFRIMSAGDYGRLIGIILSGGVVPKSPAMLSKGDTGPEVKKLNADLARLGSKLDLGEVFTDKTEVAVLAFQKAHPQLTADGVAGPATKAAIQRELDAITKGKQVGTAGGTVATGGAADVLAGGYAPLWVWITVGVLVLATAAYIAWQYRDEIRAKLDRE